MFFISLIAFISTGLLCVLMVQDLWQKHSLGVEAADRIANLCLCFGLCCTAIITSADLLHYAVW